MMRAVLASLAVAVGLCAAEQGQVVVTGNPHMAPTPVDAAPDGTCGAHGR